MRKAYLRRPVVICRPVSVPVGSFRIPSPSEPVRCDGSHVGTTQRRSGSLATSQQVPASARTTAARTTFSRGPRRPLRGLAARRTSAYVAKARRPVKTDRDAEILMQQGLLLRKTEAVRIAMNRLVEAGRLTRDPDGDLLFRVRTGTAQVLRPRPPPPV
jgi:hypothetical protein